VITIEMEIDWVAEGISICIKGFDEVWDGQNLVNCAEPTAAAVDMKIDEDTCKDDRQFTDA
jgi:hypothetical protein